MALEWPQHDPAEVLDYFVDWTFMLEGDTIASSAFSLPVITDANGDAVDDAGVTIVRSSFTDHFTGVWITGGVLGKRATVLNIVVTTGGRTIAQTVMLPVGSN